MRRPATFGLLTAFGVLAADQASKAWVLHGLDLGQRGKVTVLPVLDFVLVWNRGITFGLLSSTGASAALFAGIALVVVVVLGLWMWRAHNVLTGVALGAIGGGAIGNIVDRLRYGAVVDFIQAHALGYSWYVFNLADAAIVCGVATLIIEGLLRADVQKGQLR